MNNTVDLISIFNTIKMPKIGYLNLRMATIKWKICGKGTNLRCNKLASSCFQAAKFSSNSGAYFFICRITKLYI